jgi:hypothetical protein
MSNRYLFGSKSNSAATLPVSIPNMVEGGFGPDGHHPPSFQISRARPGESSAVGAAGEADAPADEPGPADARLAGRWLTLFIRHI